MNHNKLKKFKFFSLILGSLFLFGCTPEFFFEDSIPKGCARVVLEPERSYIIEDASKKAFRDLLEAFEQLSEVKFIEESEEIL